MKFVFYEKSMLGNFTLRTSSYPPEAKGPEGARRHFKQVIELPPEHQGMSIAQLEQIYPMQE